MIDATEYILIIGQIIGGLATLILLVASIILITKKKTLATLLILIGNILLLITSIASPFANIIAGQESMETIVMTQGILVNVRSVSYVIFAIGLLLFAVTEFTKSKTLK